MSAGKKAVREKFRTEVFARQKLGNCTFCDRQAVDAHHITDRNEMPNGGYVKENGIAVCDKHHEMAEVFHQSDGQQWVKGFHPDDLYKRIGSSYEKAVEASKRLS